MAAHQAPPSLGFSRQEHWSGLPFPSPMHESEKWKWSRSVMSNSSWPHGLQPTRLLHPWDFPGKSTGVGCHCLHMQLYWPFEFYNSLYIYLYLIILIPCRNQAVHFHFIKINTHFNLNEHSLISHLLNFLISFYKNDHSSSVKATLGEERLVVCGDP